MTPRSNTRQRLIEAASVIIDDTGPVRLRLRDVADAVGIKEPSVYKFFRNRDALIVAAGAARYARGLVFIAERFAAHATQATSREEFNETIRQTVPASTDSQRVEDRVGRVIALGMAMSRPELAEQIRLVQAEANRQVASGIRHGQKHGWVRSDMTAEAAAHWASALLSARVFLELDPQLAHSTEWDDFTTHALLAVCNPETP